MHVVVICPAVRGAMGYHLRTIAKHYPMPEQITLYVPYFFSGESLPCNIRKYPISHRRAGKLVAYFSPLWARQRFLEIRSLNPDVVHLFNSEGYPSSLLWARWVRRELKKPFIVSVHDPEPHPGTMVGAFAHRVGRQTWKQASHVHIFSECFVPLMQQFGISTRQLFMLPLCTDVSNFTKYAQGNIARESLALFFGRLEAYKGIPVLVEAAEQLRGKLRFAIAGPGRLPQRLQRRIESQPDLFELHNRFLSEAEVAHLFQRASVCVMPYIQATQSSVPWVAAAFGVPVVATATGGLIEQVRLIGGVLVPPRDPQALVQGILEAQGCKVQLPPEWNPVIILEKYQKMYLQVYEELGSK